jgi:ABC-type antimicrobial peptide transport system permease subunit
MINNPEHKQRDWNELCRLQDIPITTAKQGGTLDITNLGFLHTDSQLPCGLYKALLTNLDPYIHKAPFSSLVLVLLLLFL